MTSPDLSKLNFSDIKTSLTDYLKNQSLFVGYNFEGSALQTIVDLLAYNTYYYAFYSSMITNELFLDSAKRAASIVSLVKPLGYTIPGLKSSTASITLDTTETTIPAYSLINGVLSDGRYYSFYNTVDATVSGGSVTFIVTEAHTAVVNYDITELIDLTTQVYTLDNGDVDISTIVVEVSASNGPFKKWVNVNYFPNTDSQIYYIEREGNDFLIQFGIANNLGKSLLSTDRIRVSYLRSSGSVANGISAFSSSLGTISINEQSAGGLDGPDVNLVKFAAPKIFSAQDRAVTKNDYYGLLIRNGHITDTNDVIIYGGEDIFPPKYGRVFISYKQKPELTTTAIMNFLKEKCTLSVLPEYVLPKVLTAKVNATFSIQPTVTGTALDVLKTKITTLFSASYAKTSKFNVDFSFSDFSAQAISELKTLGLISIVFKTITYSAKTQAMAHPDTNYTHTMNFENEFTYDPTVPVYTLTTNKYGTPLRAYLPEIASSGPQPLIAKNFQGTVLDLDVGIVDLSHGYFEIPALNTTPNYDTTVAVVSTNPIISQISYSLTTLTLEPTYV